MAPVSSTPTCVLFVFCFLMAACDVGVRDKAAVRKQDDHILTSTHAARFLPTALSSIKVGISSENDLLKALGEPLEIRQHENDLNFYYNLTGINYDTSIGLQANKVSYMIYSPSSEVSLVLDDLKPYIPQYIIDQAYQQLGAPATSHSHGQTFELVSEDNSLKVVVWNNTKQSIKTLLFLN